MLKPHLFLPFAAALMAWILVTGSYKLLAGAVVAMAASCAITYCIDPSAFARYLYLMRSPSVVEEFVPCLSDAMRFAINRNAVWLQYLPAAVACLWALWYFWQRRHSWDWLENGSPLILVSLIAAPYSFLYDQSIAIPAVLHGAYNTRNRSLIVVLVGIIAIIELQALRIRITSPYYLWTAPVWLAWYLLARSRRNSQPAGLVSGSAGS
jgi:hypothetical protein